MNGRAHRSNRPAILQIRTPDQRVILSDQPPIRLQRPALANSLQNPVFIVGNHGWNARLREREISGGLEAAADAGGDGKAARFVITIPPQELPHERLTPRNLPPSIPVGAYSWPGIWRVPMLSWWVAPSATFLDSPRSVPSLGFSRPQM